VLSNENVSNNNDGGRRRGMARQAEQIVSEFQLNDVQGEDECGEVKLKEIENWNNKFAIHNNNMNKAYDDNANVFPSFLTGNTAALNADTTNVHKRMTLLSTTQKTKPQSSKVIVGDKK
jgi:hypothetical protein